MSIKIVIFQLLTNIHHGVLNGNQCFEVLMIIFVKYVSCTENRTIMATLVNIKVTKST